MAKQIQYLTFFSTFLISLILYKNSAEGYVAPVGDSYIRVKVKVVVNVDGLTDELTDGKFNLCVTPCLKQADKNRQTRP